jgi:hypothetical protein
MQNNDPTDYESYESYDTSHLLDSVLDQLQLPDDAALSETLGVAPSVISGIRDMRLPLEPEMLIRIHEITGISIIGLRNILGDRRKKLRFPDDPKGSAA